MGTFYEISSNTSQILCIAQLDLLSVTKFHPQQIWQVVLDLSVMLVREHVLQSTAMMYCCFLHLHPYLDSHSQCLDCLVMLGLA